MIPSLELFQSIANTLDYNVHLDGQLNIVGWRCSEQDGTFCDFISVYIYLHNTWVKYGWAAATVPGLPWLKAPMRAKGTAVLVPGQYNNAYALGYHKGKQALVQIEPVKVYRDNNKDSIVDFNSETIEEGLFGINIHRAGIMSKVIGEWSAGCQVFKNSQDFEQFLTLCEASGHATFTYTLMGFSYDL